MLVEDIQENYGQGWIKIFRSLMDKGWYKKPGYLLLWVHLLLKATHKTKNVFWNGKEMKLESGSFISGRKALSDETGISESSVQRILNFFENEQQIEQLKTSRSRLISITYYNEYQSSEQRSEQLVNNQRTTSEQSVNTIQELKELNNTKRKYIKEKVLFRDCIFFDKQKFKEALPDWSIEKLKYYYDSALDWSESKNEMMVNWISAVKSWARRDEKQGKIKFNENLSNAEHFKKVNSNL